MTVTIEKTTNGETDDGVDVNREESSTTTTTTNADGVVTGEHWVEDGTETKEWDEDVQPGQDVPEVEVELIPGETTTGTATETTEVTDENGTTTTTTTDRTVTASVSEVKTTVEKSETDLESIKSEDEDYADKKGVRYGKAGSDSEMEKGAYWDTDVADGGEPKPDDPGYDFQYTGLDEIALDPYRTNVWLVIYDKDQDGNVRYENGDPIIKEKVAVAPGGTLSPDWDAVGYPTQTTIKVLTQYGEDGEKERFFAYCIDKETGLVDGSWYSIANLEDSDYYVDEESEAHLRAIVTNGYWGTKEGTGSIAQIKESMLAAYKGKEDAEIKVTDKNGEEQTFKVVDLIGGLCEGEALNVTQAAIWSYSNGAINVQTGENNILVNDNFSYALTKNEDALVGAQSLARMRVMYSWLLSLEQEKSEDDTTVINEKNFLEDVTLVVGNKVEDAENNYDSDTTNDVYETSMNFQLTFVPNPEKDELLVSVTYTDYDGVERQIIKRLAGSSEENLAYDVITPDADGYYTITGLKLSENKELDFDLRIEGTQYLEEGVYIYTPYGGRDASQTLVGLAEGERQVSVTTGMTIKFDVDENNHVVAERTWHYEGDPTYTSGDTPVPLNDEPGDEPGEDPRVFRLGVNDGTVEIPDEEVPLASAPSTGDESGLWIAVILMAAVALYVVNVISKKRQNEVF